MMCINLIQLEFKKHFNVFSIIFICSIGLNVIFLKSSMNSFDMIYILANMVIYTLIFAYIFIDIYNEFYIGKEVILHMIPIKTAKVFFIKVIVFTGGLMIIWLPSFVEMFFDKKSIYNVRIINSTLPIQGIIYMISQKFIGTLSGLMLIGLAIALSKFIENKKISTCIMAIIFFASTYIIYKIDEMVYQEENKYFML